MSAELTNAELEGMTINERLAYFGFLKDFGHASFVGSRPEMVSILIKIRLSQSEAEQMAASILAKKN